MKAKVNNSWVDIPEIYTKVSGNWKLVLSGYTKVNGVWKEVYLSCPYDARIAYLESTGTQMINSGISGGSNAGYDVNFQIVSGGVNCAHFFGSSRNETTSPKIYKSGSTTNVTAEWYTTSSNSISPIFTENPDKIHNVRFYNGTLTYDGTSTSTGNLGFGSKPFCIFDYTAETGLGSKMKLYDCKVYLDGTLVRDFIPVRKGQVGYLYDKISGNLYGNAGTGSFTLGPEINDITITLTSTDGTSVNNILIAVTDLVGTTHIGTTNALGQLTLSGVANGVALIIAYGFVLSSSTITINNSVKTFNLLCLKDPNYVDLGLPSGLLWAKGNLIKDSQGNYSIGSETDYGVYLSWGNINGYNKGEGYNFSSDNYSSTSGKTLTTSISSNDAEHDICRARLGSKWRLPTLTECQELVNNTDQTYIQLSNGKYGCKFAKKTDSSIYIIFPMTGRYDGTTLSYESSFILCWSSTYKYTSQAYTLTGSSSGGNTSDNSKYRGLTVRPVIKLA